jgi:2'-5' RNA ligase
MTIRSFVAVPLPSQTMDKLQQMTAILRGQDKHGDISTTYYFRQIKKNWTSNQQIPPFSVQLSFQVNDIIIYQSRLNPQGSRHSPLFKIKLKNEYPI